MLKGIPVFPDVPNLNVKEYYSHVDQVSVIKTPEPSDNECDLCLVGCTKDIPAFAYLNDVSDTRRNDFSSFYEAVPVTNSMVVATLYKYNTDGTTTTYAINDNTYGQFYNTNTIKDGIWAFILEWHKVASTLGFGKYKVEIEIYYGFTEPQPLLRKVTTGCYNLRPYSCDAVHGTVRFTTEMSGYFQNGLDYRDLEIILTDIAGGNLIATSWPQQLRWYGKMKAEIPTYERDLITDKFYNEREIQSLIYDNYSVQLYHIQGNVSRPFLRNQFLAPVIFIDDYNINNQEVYINVRVNPTEIGDRKTFNLNKNEFFTLNFEEYNKGNIHRN